jgi:hypothetical protein
MGAAGRSPRARGDNPPLGWGRAEAMVGVFLGGDRVGYRALLVGELC